MRNGDVIERPVDHRTLTRRYTEEAVTFIDGHRGPAVLPLPRPQSCRTFRSRGRPTFVGHSAAGMYGDVVEELDASTGRILDALRAAGLDRRTLVVFTSDNGPWLPFEAHGGSAGPLREGKGTTWEGGVRTPAIFWWPGTVRPGVVTDIGSAMDLFATAGSLAGAELPADRVDRRRRSARARSTGPVRARGRRSSTTGTASCERCAKGAYKAHFITSGAYGSAASASEHNPPLLFDLRRDPGEQPRRRRLASGHRGRHHERSRRPQGRHEDGKAALR